VLPTVIVFIYLAVVLYVGIFAFRRGGRSAEDFFVANRSLGTFVFLLSLFGTNMTAFSILGASGLSFRAGIGVYGLMASISAIVLPLMLFLVGTRVWAIGKKYGHMTQVAIFRDRWEMGHIGTVIFVLQALMLVPYIIIGVMGGGETLNGVSGDRVPYWAGGLVVALVVMSYVFFGGMRGTAWVNTLQTLMFLVFGTIAFIIVARGMGGVGKSVDKMANPPATQPVMMISGPEAVVAKGPPTDRDVLTRTPFHKGTWFSYMLIPLSSIMFPHIAIFCLTAKRMGSFKKTVILYPLCIMAIWLPSVFLGTLARSQPAVVAAMAAESPGFRDWAATADPSVVQLVKDVAERRIAPDDPRVAQLDRSPVKGELRRLATPASDGVMIALLKVFSPEVLAGLLGAAIMAAVMASDSQILALSTMWAEDVYGHYGGKQRYGEAAQVWSARVFVVILTAAAYVIALLVHKRAGIFELAIQYAFSGYASLTPVMLACLFWKRSTKWGVLASVLWIAVALVATSVIQHQTQDVAPRGPGPAVTVWSIGETPIVLREFNRVVFTNQRHLMVMPMFIGAVIALVVGSYMTAPPSRRTLARYFADDEAGVGLRPLDVAAGARSR
jgi:solute:Na+ symporter, SSS family